MIIAFAVGVVATLVTVMAAFLAIKFSQNSKLQREDLLERMEENFGRLQSAVTELLARADEADQESKYLRKGLHPELSRRLSKACSELVVLGDKVKLIENRLAKKDTAHAGHEIIKTLDKANRLSSEIREIREAIKKEQS